MLNGTAVAGKLALKVVASAVALTSLGVVSAQAPDSPKTEITVQADPSVNQDLKDAQKEISKSRQEARESIRRAMRELREALRKSHVSISNEKEMERFGTELGKGLDDLAGQLEISFGKEGVHSSGPEIFVNGFRMDVPKVNVNIPPIHVHIPRIHVRKDGKDVNVDPIDIDIPKILVDTQRVHVSIPPIHVVIPKVDVSGADKE